VFFCVLASVVPTGASSTGGFSEKFQVSQHAMRVAVVCYALVLRSAALRDEISRFEPLELEVGKRPGTGAMIRFAAKNDGFSED
jgi:hypothetical protein